MYLCDANDSVCNFHFQPIVIVSSPESVTKRSGAVHQESSELTSIPLNASGHKTRAQQRKRCYPDTSEVSAVQQMCNFHVKKSKSGAK